VTEYYAEGRALSREGAFQLVAEEVWRDGQVEDFEQNFLEALARFLNLDAAMSRKILHRVEDLYRRGRLGESRRLDPELLYYRILFIIWSDGRVDQLETRILAGLQRALRVTPEMHEQILQNIQRKNAT